MGDLMDYRDLPEELRAFMEDRFAYMTTPVPTAEEASRAVEAIVAPLLDYYRPRVADA